MWHNICSQPQYKTDRVSKIVRQSKRYGPIDFYTTISWIWKKKSLISSGSKDCRLLFLSSFLFFFTTKFTVFLFLNGQNERLQRKYAAFQFCCPQNFFINELKFMDGVIKWSCSWILTLMILLRHQLKVDKNTNQISF